MLPGDPLWTGDPTPMGLKNVRLHNQNNSAAVRFQRVALAGEDQAAHPGQTGDAAGGLLADKREVAVDDEQRGRVGGRRILDACTVLKMQTGQMGSAGAVGRRDESGPRRATCLQRIGAGGAKPRQRPKWDGPYFLPQLAEILGKA